MMRDPLKLLQQATRAAYPQGVLLVRGVTTFGDFTCIGEVKGKGPQVGWHFVRCAGALCLVKAEDSPERVRGLAGMVGQSDDDLLPDLTDSATFHLAKQDLVFAMSRNGIGYLASPDNYGEPWFIEFPTSLPGSEPDVDLPVAYGEEFWWEHEGGKKFYGHKFPAGCAQDSVMALLLARAWVREETGR